MSCQGVSSRDVTVTPQTTKKAQLMATVQKSDRRKRELKHLLKRGSIWYFRVERKGKVTCTTLDTPDEDLARRRRDVLMRNIANDRWELIDGLKATRNIATVGEVIERYSAAVDLQLSVNTMRDYCWAVRKILKTIMSEGRLSDEAVNQLPVTVLNAGLVRKWQQHCLAKLVADGHGGDKLKEDTAAISCNSMIAQARSLFSKRVMSRKVYEGLNVPDLKEFLGAPVLNVLKRDVYHKPPEEVIAKIWKAARELRDGCLRTATDGTELEGPPWKRPGLWLVFYLAAQTGMRKGELRAVRYRWLGASQDGKGAMLTVAFETDFVSKGKRERLVPIAAAVEIECRRVAKENGWPTELNDYVVPGLAADKETLFRELGSWMTEQGWTRRQKAHELRKIFASDLTEAGDPYDTQLALGHGDIKTTMRYAARREVRAVDQAQRYAA